jgi:preprotein translocase subunit YajC
MKANRFCLFGAVLFQIGSSYAFAQAAPSAPSEQSVIPAETLAEPSFGEVFMQMLPVYALVIVVYYLMVLKPQQKKLSAQLELKSALKKGDNVVTSSGILGKISAIEEDIITLEIAANTKVKFEAKHIVGKAEKAVAASNAAVANG